MGGRENRIHLSLISEIIFFWLERRQPGLKHLLPMIILG